jgi:regulator of protease activity HflC (stomatin/prohibitin superfamily)
MTILTWAIGLVLGVIGTIYLGNMALAWISAPSDFLVFVGVILLASLASGVVIFALWLVSLVRNKMNSGFAIVLLLASLVVTGCTSVPPGYVGLKVYQYGSQKGVDDFPQQTGAVLYFPPTTDVVSFPVFTQRVVYDNKDDDKIEGDETDESIQFRSAENATLFADVGLTFSLKPEKVAHIFVTYRQDLFTLERGIIRDRIRSAFNRHAPKQTTMQLMGSGLGALETAVTEDVRKELEPHGIHIEAIQVVSRPRVDRKVEDSINAVLTAMQNANAAEQRVREVEAEARQAIARAKGQADSMLTVAEGEAAANRKITESLSEELIRYRALGKWNGQLPQVSGAATPFVNLK